MGGLKDSLRRLKREARQHLESFELLDGSRYYFDAASFELFEHYYECGKHSAPNWPEPPEVVRKLTEAKDVAQALEKVHGGGWNFLVYDAEVLINERRLEPRPLFTRRDPHTGVWTPVDPYEQEIEDLSE